MTQTSEGMVRATRVAPDRGLRFAMRAFGNRDFAIFWCGAMATNVGGWFQSLSAPYVLYDITQSATWVGLAVAGQFLPGVLLVVVAVVMGLARGRRSLRRLDDPYDDDVAGDGHQ